MTQPQTPKLPNVHPEVYDRSNEVLRALSESPLPLARHQALANNVRAVLTYVETLEGKVAKLEEEIAQAVADLKKLTDTKTVSIPTAKE